MPNQLPVARETTLFLEMLCDIHNIAGLDVNFPRFAPARGASAQSKGSESFQAVWHTVCTVR